MSNELVTKFIFDSADSDRRISLTEKRLVDLDKQLNGFGQNPTFGKGLGSQFDALTKKVNQFESNLKKVGSTELKAVGNDLLKQVQIERVLEQTKRTKVQTLAEEVKLERQKLGLQSDQLRLERAKSSLQTRRDAPFRAITSDIQKSLNQDLAQSERSKAKEVAAINAQTQRLAKQQSDFRATIAKRTADAEIAEERRVDSVRKQTARDYAARAQAKLATRTSAVGNEILGGLGVTLGVGAGVAVGVKFLKDSVSAAFDAERANRKLSASATEAGLAYGVLAEKNRQFAQDAALSETVATNVTAKIAQLATFGGRPQDIGKLQKSFLDLSAAKGIDSKDIDTLIGTILSGQDEGLNRLGLSDPGQLYKAYAKEIGAGSRELSQFEKVQAATNAVVEKAAIFNGANAEKLASVSGQAEKARANLENLYTNVGTGIIQTMEFRDAVGLLSDALGGLSLNFSDVRKQLAEGLTPKQIAEKNANGFGARTLDFIKDSIGKGTAAIALPYDLVTEGFDVAKRRFFETSEGAKNRRLVADTQAITAEQKLLQRQGKDAEEQKNALVGKTLISSFQSRIDGFTKAGADGVAKAKISVVELNKLEKEFNQSLGKFGAENDPSKRLLRGLGFGVLSNNISKINQSQVDKVRAGIDDIKKKFYSERADAAEKRFGRNPNLEDAKFNLNALNGIKKFLPEEQFESFSDKLSDFIKDETQKIGEKIRDLSKTYKDIGDDLRQRANPDNPFASLFSEADKSLLNLRENLRGLSPEIVSTFEQMEAKASSLKLFEARIDNNLGAFDLRERARELRGTNFKAPLKIDDPGKFFNDYIEFYSKKLETDFRRAGGGLRFNLTGDGKMTQGFSQSTDSPFIRYNSNIFTDKNGKQFTNGFSQSESNPLIRYNSNIFTDKNGKQFTNGFSQSQLSFADLTEREKSDFINASTKPEVNLALNDRLQRQRSIIYDGAFSEEQKSLADRKYLSLTSGVSRDELSMQNREDLALVAERTAERQERAETEERAARVKSLELSQKIADELAKIREIAEKEGLTKTIANTIRFVDDTSGGGLKPQLPASANSNDTKNAYSGGTFYDEYESQ